jgi:hypothetical protein
MTMKTSTLVSLLLCMVGNPFTAAFQQANSNGARTTAFKRTSADSIFATSMMRHQSSSREHKLTRSSSTTTSLSMLDPTSVGATIIALASAAAAWQEYRTDRFQAYREISGRPNLFLDEETSATVAEGKTAESTTPTPAPKKSFVSKLNPLRAKTAPAPEPVNVSKSAPAPAPKPLTLEVGNTVEKNREMNELGEKRKQQDAAAAAEAAAKKKKEDDAGQAAAGAAKPAKKRGFFRKTWRVVKKIVAPWRKWENIS